MGGSVPFPVLDNNGNNSGCFVDLQLVHDSFMELERSVLVKDSQEDKHFIHVKKMLNNYMNRFSPQHTANLSPSFHGNERWRRPMFPKQQKKSQYGKYHGGMASEEPKNE